MSRRNIAYERTLSPLSDDGVRLSECGITFDEVFSESETDRNKRPQLDKCLNYIDNGDTLHINSIICLAENLFEFKSIVDICILKGVTLRLHHDDLTFCGSDSNECKLLFKIMDAIFKFERAYILNKFDDSLKSRLTGNRNLKKKPRLNQAQKSEIRRRAIELHENKKSLAKEYGVTTQTIHNVLKKTS